MAAPAWTLFTQNTESAAFEGRLPALATIVRKIDGDGIRGKAGADFVYLIMRGSS
jgi:hypothetical protein